jgi:hypothetical protein
MPHFFCIAQGVIHHFHFWLSYKSIQISEKGNDGVIAWQGGIFSGCEKGKGTGEERDFSEVFSYFLLCSAVPEVT